MRVDTREGIFGTEGFGGGVFNDAGALGAVSQRRARPAAGLGQFVVDVPPQCFNDEGFRECYYRYEQLAAQECSDPDVLDMYVDRVDCIRDLVQNDLWSRCIPNECPEAASSRGVPKYELFPQGVYSEATKGLQEDLNVTLARHGCELLTVDGKLGAKTCGAARWAGGGTEPPTCTSFTTPNCPGLEPDPVTPAPVTPTPGPITPGPLPVPPKKGLNKAWMLVGGLALAAAIGGSIYAMQKKGKLG